MDEFHMNRYGRRFADAERAARCVAAGLLALVAGCGAPARAPGPAAAPQPRAGHTAADVQFMQHMIVHHAQALVMADLAPARTEREEIRRLAERITVSQKDEIAMMERWLRERGADSRSGHQSHEAMPGMLRQDELDRLAAARGAEFDRLFLEFMIRHHEGALVMVKDLFASPGAGQAPEVFQFASEVDADQRMEIDRMRALLAALEPAAR